MIFNSYAEQSEALAGIKIVSTGHIFAKPQREINRPDGREDWLLFYVAKESETFYIGETAVLAPAGSFILYAPGETQHHVYEGNKTAEFYYVHFKCDALPEHLSLKTSRVYTLSPQPLFSSIFEEILEETLQKKPHYESLCISNLCRVLALIKREVAETDTSLSGQWRSVARAIQHMRRYPNTNLKLADYADMCCVSKFHFARIFKEVTGDTPLNYRNKIRIELAKELLENDYLAVCEIAESLGFASAAYFSDSFKKFVGISPSEYRVKSSKIQ